MNFASDKEGAQFQVSLNYFEIYKESLNNLLGTSKSSAENLKISNSRVLNANPVPVSSPGDIFRLIQIGQQKVHI
jgi:hypothetical protein